MDQYLYLLFSRSPRRIKVIENVLQNHRTQANLFWAFNYGILDWLGADRRMRRADLANWLSQAQAKGLMQVDQQSAWLTPAGLQRQQQVVQTYYQPHFNQWTWLSNPSDFADRFSLGIQALSELVHNEKKYVPLSLSITEMTKVRTWLMTKGLQTRVYQELMAIGTQLEKQDPRLATLFAHELFGYQLSGWTLEQASSQLHVHLEEAMMMDRDLWLGVAHLVSARPGNLQALMGDLLAAMPISASAWLTVQQLQAGKSVQQIAMMRHLKPSTIREHLLEAAIIIPQALDWDRLLPAKTRQQLATQYHGPVLKWQFIKPAHQDENAAFFSFRLYQIWRRWYDHG